MTEFAIIACGAFAVFALFMGVMALKAHRQSASQGPSGGCASAVCHCRGERSQGTVQIAATPQAVLSSSKRERK